MLLSCSSIAGHAFWIFLDHQESTRHAGSQPWSPGVSRCGKYSRLSNLKPLRYAVKPPRCTESNQPILLPGSPMLWCLQLPSQQDSTNLNPPSPSSAKNPKVWLIPFWFYLVISRMLPAHFPLFLDGNPLSFMLQFPRKLIFTGEPTKRKLHFPVQIAIFVAELPY